MYQKLDDDYIKYKDGLNYIIMKYTYIKNHPEEFDDDLLEEINESKHLFSKICYLISDLKYLKKKLNAEINLNGHEFDKLFKHEDYQDRIKQKDRFNEAFDNKLIDPLEFYKIINNVINDETNKDKKRYKLLQRVKNM